MVVGRDSGEPAVPGRVDGALEPRKRQRRLTEAHQREVDAEIHRRYVAISMLAQPDISTQTRRSFVAMRMSTASQAAQRRTIPGAST